mgnify:CR=1 FL=1
MQRDKTDYSHVSFFLVIFIYPYSCITARILSGCDLAVDALDGNRARKTLRNACRDLGIPMVHGAIAGFWGQAGVFFPGDATPWDAPEGELPDRGVELETGNPPFTPALVAALEAAEAIKILANVSKPLRHRLLWADLDRGEFHKLRLLRFPATRNTPVTDA